MKRKSPSFRYSLRVFIFALTVLCMLLAILVARMANVHRYEQAIAELRSIGGKVNLDDTQHLPVWMQAIDLPQVRLVCLDGLCVTQDTLRSLSVLDSLQKLDLNNVQLESSTGLYPLRSLSNLQSLSLSNSAVTDEDIRHLNCLSSLTTLSLSNTAVGDKGFAELQTLTQLNNLDISECHITGAGLGPLRFFKQLYGLQLDDWQVTPDTIKYLDGLPLRRLVVRIPRGTGRIQHDLLAPLHIAEIVGIADQHASIVWTHELPWDETPAGMFETMQDHLQLELDGQQAASLLAILAHTHSDWIRSISPAHALRLPVEIPPPIAVPTRVQSSRGILLGHPSVEWFEALDGISDATQSDVEDSAERLITFISDTHFPTQHLAITTVGRWAEHRVRLTQHIVLRLLHEYETNAASRRAIEDAFCRIVIGVHRATHKS